MKQLIPKTIHFIGIGGIGMSALARYFLAKKWAVSGSDIVLSEITRELEKQGVKVKFGHKKAYISPETELVIHSQAIPASNPELKEARKRGIKTLAYPKAIGELTRQYKTIAIAGAHGKSTTTALVSLILIKAGLDPTVIIGTKLKEFGNASLRFGSSEYFVLEADEYGGAFLHYSPTNVIITNIDREHLDFYKNLGNIKKAFLKFINNIQYGGILILNKDDKNLFSLNGRIGKIAKKNKLNVHWYTITKTSRSWAICYKIAKALKISGAHNVSNAMAAYTLAKALGVEEKVILKAISQYHGSWRRMEYRGKFLIPNSKFLIPIFDDYAHHPTEIKATLAALKEKFPKKQIICVFQPHQAKRLKLLFKDFVHAFDIADILVLLPIYKVPGRDEMIYKQFTSQKLANVIAQKKTIPQILYLPHPTQLPSAIGQLIHNSKFIIHNSLVVMMGAGDIVKYTDLLLRYSKR